MIRIVMFDLGLTLVDLHNRPFKHVPEALAAIASLKTADAKPLRYCLVSDFTMPAPPTTARKVREIFDRYLGLLDQTGLRPYFEPVQRRVTLSTHAGVMKPHRTVFEVALRRLRADVTLEECLLVTENGVHIKAARDELHMQTLRFRASGSTSFDFGNWSQAPALIAHLLAPHQETNLHAVVKAHLAAKGMELSDLARAGSASTFKASGQMWCPVSVPGGAMHTIHVAVPVAGQVTQGPKGELRSSVRRPTGEQIAEATAFAGSLAAHGQIALDGAAPGAGVTHEIAVDPTGQRRLTRKRFTAL